MIIDVCDINTYPKKFTNLIDSGTFTEEDAYQTIKDCSLVSFHYTRLYDVKKILKEGLKQFNYLDNTEYVCKIYKKVYKNKEEAEKIKEIMFEYQKNFPNKKQKLWFICGISKETETYSQYYSMFGGECISNATKIDNNIHNNLIKIGNNYCVKFLVPVEYIKKTNVGEQIDRLVNTMKKNYLNLENCPCEAHLCGYDISPNLIQSIDIVLE